MTHYCIKRGYQGCEETSPQHRSCHLLQRARIAEHGRSSSMEELQSATPFPTPSLPFPTYPHKKIDVISGVYSKPLEKEKSTEY